MMESPKSRRSCGLGDIVIVGDRRPCADSDMVEVRGARADFDCVDDRLWMDDRCASETLLYLPFPSISISISLSSKFGAKLIPPIIAEPSTLRDTRAGADLGASGIDFRLPGFGGLGEDPSTLSLAALAFRYPIGFGKWVLFLAQTFRMVGGVGECVLLFRAEVFRLAAGFGLFEGGLGE
jgi:hypothetical protein